VGADFHAAQQMLRVGRLLRATGPAGEELVAPYHDRVREAILANLPSEARREHHLALAQAAASADVEDPEFLAIHFHGAGEHQTAAGHYAAAGAAATAATAFEQAARLYHLAAELGTWPAAKAAWLRAAEADALANAGRGAAAAEAYLAAAARADADAALEWRRRAAEQYLISGHLDVGLGVFRQVVAAVGITFPETPFRALVGFLIARLRLWLRGVGFQSRPPESIPPEELRRIDVCWSAAAGFSITDFIRGAYFQTQGLLLALRAGEPTRVARSLAIEGAHAAVAGPGGDARSLRLVEAAAAVAAVVPNPYLGAVVKLARGMRDYLSGRFRKAAATLREAQEEFRHGCTGVTWELDTATTCWLWCLSNVGELAEVAAHLPALLKDARDRGDLYTEVNMGTETWAITQLMRDEPERALAGVRETMSRWSRRGYHIQHHNELLATVIIHLYRGDGPAAWDFIRGKEPVYRRLRMWDVQHIRLFFLQLRARSALAAAGEGPQREALLRAAERDARKLEGETAAWGQALGCLFRACVHDARKGAGGPGLFAVAAGRLEAADLGVFAAAARYRQGERTGGEEGRRLRDEAVARLAGQGVRDPVRMIWSHAPTSSGGSRPRFTAVTDGRNRP
jgi:hypothetical protein